MYSRVVVALDGSPEAEAIVPLVLEIAGPLDMEVVLLRVVVPVPPVTLEGSRQIIVEDVEATRRDAEEYLAPLAAELRAKGVRAHAQVRRGQAVEQIVAAAQEIAADLIAMTTHGRSGLGRLLLGSVAEAVLRHSHLPVFLLRVTESERARRLTQQAGATSATR
jgi:nucleotide-binding universal stress UspA family protein